MTNAEQQAALPRAKILVVDDNDTNRLVMRRLLDRVDAELFEAESGNQAISQCLSHEFALILLDVQMPDMDGFEVAELVAQEGKSRNSPIIFVTAVARDELSQIRGYGTGAVDYIAKPVNTTILYSKIQVFLELYRARQELHGLLEELDQRNAALMEEIAERRKLEELARHQAGHDVLTDLPNRRLFMDRLNTAVDRMQRSGKAIAMIYIDIDGFKPVNDSHGHQVGDELLKAVAQRLLEAVRREDTVARLGGDEFAVVMESMDAVPQTAIEQGNKLIDRLSKPYRLTVGDKSLTLHISASIGVALAEGQDVCADDLIRDADHAMYRAKREGGKDCRLAS